MSSDEDDYMSATFVVDDKGGDIRPGLLHSRQQQRSHEILKKKSETDALNRERFRPQKVIEAERREEGLQAAIGSNNKGFSLLQKMGYKPGTGIGKSGEGRIDPVPIQLKTDRQGLGRTAAIKEIREAKKRIRAQRQANQEEVTPEQFRARLIQKSNQRFIEIDLSKSQKACFNLDSKEGVKKPAELWFWPESVLNQHEEKGGDAVTAPSDPVCSSPLSKQSSDEESDTDVEEEFEPSEKLEMLTKYLRTSYCYCTWCCVRYDDEKDMEKDCPGPTRDDH